MERWTSKAVYLAAFAVLSLPLVAVVAASVESSRRAWKAYVTDASPPSPLLKRHRLAVVRSR